MSQPSSIPPWIPLAGGMIAVVSSIAVPPQGQSPAINWLAIFFAITTFYSEILAAVPTLRSNAIYQQIGALLNTAARMLRPR
jgi:hypothetical protein